MTQVSGEKDMEMISSNQIERLFFIEKMLRFAGSINRRDLVDGFSVKEAAATRDLALYREIAPKNTSYDSKSRSYLKSDSFKIVFEHTFSSSLRIKGSSSRQPEVAESIPHVDVDSFPGIDFPKIENLEAVTRSITTKTYLLITYYSLSSVSKKRKIAPFAVLNNGFRWYTRAFDVKRNEFRDFILNRMDSPETTKDSVHQDHLIEADHQWSRFVELKIAAHNRRENIERPETLEIEYDMQDVGKRFTQPDEPTSRKDIKVMSVKTRAALAGYLLRKLNVDCSENHSLVGKEYQLRLMNTAALYGVSNLNLAPGYKAPEF